MTNAVNVIEGGDKTIHITVHLVPVADSWQGTTRQPQQVTASEASDADSPYYGLSGWYKITDADELAWIAAQVNSGNNALNAVLANDICLAGNNWTPIGNNSTKYSDNVISLLPTLMVPVARRPKRVVLVAAPTIPP